MNLHQLLKEQQLQCKKSLKKIQEQIVKLVDKENKLKQLINDLEQELPKHKP